MHINSIRDAIKLVSEVKVKSIDNRTAVFQVKDYEILW